MASVVLAQAGAKLFHKNVPGYAPPDPIYETYIDKDGEKTRQRDIPAGLSRRDIQILQNVRIKAHKLDNEFSIFGFTFGWGFIITLVPGLGDVLNLFLNYWLIAAQAQKAELPDWLATEMLTNQVITCGCGMVPILGDLVVAIFACSSRNVALLEEYLAIRGAEYLKPEGDRHYDPKDIKPGAGMEPGESPSYHPTFASANPDQEPLINSKDWEV
ncbi:hypothetical protein BDM02DRAFT_3109373 [Thelephora ganbajun]|uniref:Uncharacterized protein n=1 Tax=Thelephora ganbajun TaxID=370292 RepID=A0ACB6ZS48_THEGA|nr:hypothetical protein BDM02DRAFT_3109373 [Thelephora ganbajun]